ncbi:MAG: AAA family ATPase [Janthinobacterium lividum]
MTARIKELVDLDRLRQFVVCTPSTAHARWLASAVHQFGIAVHEYCDADQVERVLASNRPDLMFIDFSGRDESVGGAVSIGEVAAPSSERLTRAAAIARACARSAPQMPVIAIGSSRNAEGTLAALRAGVREFIDISSSDQEVVDIVERVIEQAATAAAPQDLADPARSRSRGRMIVILGARIGVGATTLAAHLAVSIRGIPSVDSAQRRSKLPSPSVIEPTAERVKSLEKAGKAGIDAGQRVALLDLGLPGGDGLLYMNATGNFHFAEAVRNLARFDETFVRTALTSSTYDVSVVSLPPDLSEMRMVSQSDSLAVFDELRRYFDTLVVDLGGFSNFDFIANIVKNANQVWMVTDQSVGSIVSLSESLKELEDRSVSKSGLRLIVNRYDERYGMSAFQIAERFSVKLAGTLPDRALPLLRHANLGQLLVGIADQDAYLKSLRTILRAGLAETQSVPSLAVPAAVRQLLPSWMRRG